MTPRDIVYRIASHIPMGRVMTYGDLAALSDCGARTVGSALHRNPDPDLIPCHRIVSAAGAPAARYAFGGVRVQTSKLMNEGVPFRNTRVDLDVSRWKPTSLYRTYVGLLVRFGDPGPWPWFGQDRPHTPDEIAIGAILTQNTNWMNVLKALSNLRSAGCAALDRIACASGRSIEHLIRPSGFFRQKADRLIRFANVVSEAGGLSSLLDGRTEAVREQLLVINGIGPETVDTMLLYAGDHPVFVVDAYTKRFARTKKLTSADDYDSLQAYFTERLPMNIGLFRDFHALIVAWGKAQR